MNGKKGMSPLIATILLMAFAVALGAVIMNMGANLPEGGPNCEEVSVDVRSVCLENSHLSISLRNVGEKSIEKIGLSVDDPPVHIPEIAIQRSRLDRGEILNEKMPFGFSANATIGIIPFILDKGELVACQEPVHVEKTLLPC